MLHDSQPEQGRPEMNASQHLLIHTYIIAPAIHNADGESEEAPIISLGRTQHFKKQSKKGKEKASINLSFSLQYHFPKIKN